MKKYLKFLLTPCRMLLWYLLTYYGVYIAVIGMIYIYTFSWIWLILVFGILFAVLYVIVSTIPAAIQLFIVQFYGGNWFTSICHCIAGILGLLGIGYLFYIEPPVYLIEGEKTFFLTGMWRTAPFKTIFIAVPIIYFISAIAYVTVVTPFVLLFSKDRNQ